MSWQGHLAGVGGISKEQSNWAGMSATLDVVQREALDGEAPQDGGDAGPTGVVIPLRRREAVLNAASPRPELEPISPELALVDPELARAARAPLPDPFLHPPVQTEAPAAPVDDQYSFVEQLRGGLALDPAVESTRSHVRAGMLAVVGLATLAASFALLVRHEGTRVPVAQRQASPTIPPAEPTPGVRSVDPTAPPVSTRSPEEPTPATSRTAAEKPAPPASTVPPETPSPAASTGARAGTSGIPSTTPSPATTRRAQTFVWASAPDATAYEFQLFRNRERIFRARVDEPRLVLPGRWRQGGRTFTLTPGSYRWYVWPVSGRTERQSAVAIVQARLVVPRDAR